MATGKNLLKSMQGVLQDTNLKCNEKVLLLYFVQCHNYEKGYAYPSYENIKKVLSTKRDETVSNAIKGLVKKEYVQVEKYGVYNHYYILKHLFYIGEDIVEDPTPKEIVEDPKPVQAPIEEVKPVEVVAEEPQEVKEESGLDRLMTQIKADREKEIEDVAPLDSNGNKPVAGQIHISDLGIDSADITHIKGLTGAKDHEVAEMFQLANGNKGLILKAYGYTKNQNGVKHIPSYVKKMIKTFKDQPQSDGYRSYNKTLDFNNFEARQYNYDALENRLLGWEEYNEADGTFCTYDPSFNKAVK